MMNSNGRNDRGFALPMALMMLLITAGVVMTTLNQSTSDLHVVDSEEAGDAALVMAETALEQVVTNWQAWGFAAPPTATYDSIRIANATGYVDLIWRRLRAQSMQTPAIYLVRSRGVYTRDDWAGAAEATRVVTRYMQWEAPALDVRSAWTALGGLNKNGSAGTFSGTDVCGVQPPVAGVAVPTVPGYTQSGGTSIPSGTPPIMQLAPTPLQAADSINIDWQAVLNEDVIQFDVTIPPDPWPTFTDPNYWPVIYVDNPGGDLALPTNGRGVLIVRGSLSIGGNTSWDGVVLVGNKVTANGTMTFEGATISGLNLQLGEPVLVSDVANGTKIFRYNSCKVWNAFQNKSRLRAFANTWSDSWALY
jgi:hypothetical protein